MRVRSGRKIWLVALMVFVAVFLFTFLTAKFKDNIDVEAANLANFDPGYIISDYQMGNYNSMSEAEIWNFLKQKGNCNDTRIWQTGNNLGYLSESAPYSWHVSDGHYVCLADENFSGESAAHIIWQAAQDYRINPQVLIVLLQKEQGLITDSFPNSVQYRSATGYGCPDTAACSSRYYGFKNQVRNAAALFRTVLDGGWTNYPLGNNYIQYNPNSGCGGSWVNIRSLATSALYRYTPYQPNASALVAGYGAGDSCGAYGNRNFYSYFEDWFGGITQTTKWIRMDQPRYMTANKNTNFFSLSTSNYSDINLLNGKINYYVAKTYISNGKMCLRTIDGERVNGDKCVLYEDLNETDWRFSKMETSRYLMSTESSKIIDVNTLTEKGNPKKYEFYDEKVFLPNGDMCLRIKNVSNNDCVLYSTLKEAEFEELNMEEPRYFVGKNNNISIMDPIKDQVVGFLDARDRVYFKTKIITPNGRICLLTQDLSEKYSCVYFDDLSEIWLEMEKPRIMKMIKNSYKINAVTLKNDYGLLLPLGMERKFVMKRYLKNGEWCLQTEYDYERNLDNCILFSTLGEK